MTDQFTRQAQDMLAAAKEARIPENVQAFAEDSVAKTREAYSKMSAATKDSVKAMHEIVLAAQSAAMAKVPRHEFVPVELRPYAYANIPLPIGFEKTISQPFIVAEAFTGKQGKVTPILETIRSFEEIADGKWDHLPESAFLYVGGIQEAAEQAERMAKA